MIGLIYFAIMFGGLKRADGEPAMAATTVKKLWGANELNRIQREADREFVESNLSRLKVTLCGLGQGRQLALGLTIAKLLDLYMEGSDIQEAAIVAYGLKAAAAGQGDEALAALRELAT